MINRAKPRNIEDLYSGIPKQTARKQGIEIQTWGIAADLTLVCAGTYWVNALEPKAIFRCWHHWARWRRWYDNRPANKDRDYPAKHSKPVAYYGAHPVGQPGAMVWLTADQKGTV